LTALFITLDYISQLWWF